MGVLGGLEGNLFICSQYSHWSPVDSEGVGNLSEEVFLFLVFK